MIRKTYYPGIGLTKMLFMEDLLLYDFVIPNSYF